MTTTNNNPSLKVNQKESTSISKLVNIILPDIDAIIELYKPIEDSLTEADKKYLEQLERCSLILNVE